MAEDLAVRERLKRLQAQFDTYMGGIFGRLALLEAIFDVRVHPGLTLAEFRLEDMSPFGGAVITADDAGENGYFKKVATSHTDNGRDYINDKNGLSFQRVSML